MEAVRGMRTERPSTDTGIELLPMPQQGREDRPDGPKRDPNGQTGVSRIEATMAIWGRTGKRLIILGLALFMILFELDNSTVYVYHNYATSTFASLSALGTLSTGTAIVFAVTKPLAAKISDVIGRGQTLIIAVTIYLVAYILMASAESIRGYAAGMVLYSIAQSGASLMAAVVISDITTPRWRGFSLGLSYLPFVVTPWIAALMVDRVVNGIGWRWGVGIYAILMPLASSLLIATLLVYERRARKQGLIGRAKLSLYRFCSEIDLGGLLLFMGGFACLLLPLSLAATQGSKWTTPWVLVVTSIGVFLLIAFPFYEKHFAVNPLAPASYFRNATIVLSLFLVAVDSIGFSCTHTYLYAWSTITLGFNPRIAAFYVYTNGVTQCLAGVLAGAIMLLTGRYKWLVTAGTAIRIVGYGMMTQLRGQDNSTAELFIQQLIQGLGSGIIQTALLVPPQIVVPRTQIAQVFALVLSFSFLGSSIGSCIAGVLYTSTFRERLRDRLGGLATDEMVNDLFQSITGTIPGWGTPERGAVNNAYSDVMRYMTCVALGTSIPAFIMCFLVPNLSLPRERNFFVRIQPSGQNNEVAGEHGEETNPIRKLGEKVKNVMLRIRGRQ